jgi:hypothetical protein
MSKQTTTQPKPKITPKRVSSETNAAKPQLGKDHPLNDILGTYEGPVWDRILKNIKRNRKKQDQEEMNGAV